MLAFCAYLPQGHLTATLHARQQHVLLVATMIFVVILLKGRFPFIAQQILPLI